VIDLLNKTPAVSIPEGARCNFGDEKIAGGEGQVVRSATTSGCGSTGVEARTRFK